MILFLMIFSFILSSNNKCLISAEKVYIEGLLCLKIQKQEICYLSVHTWLYFPSLMSFCLLRNQSGILYWRGLLMIVTIFSTWNHTNSVKMFPMIRNWEIKFYKLSEIISLNNPKEDTQVENLSFLYLQKLYNKTSDCSVVSIEGYEFSHNCKYIGSIKK